MANLILRKLFGGEITASMYWGLMTSTKFHRKALDGKEASHIVLRPFESCALATPRHIYLLPTRLQYRSPFSNNTFSAKNVKSLNIGPVLGTVKPLKSRMIKEHSVSKVNGRDSYNVTWHRLRYCCRTVRTNNTPRSSPRTCKIGFGL